MESIVLHSDVARLVLGYLVNQDLKKAAHTLCRTCGRNTLPSSGACRRTTFSMAAWRTSYASTSRSLDLVRKLHSSLLLLLRHYSLHMYASTFSGPGSAEAAAGTAPSVAIAQGIRARLRADEHGSQLEHQQASSSSNSGGDHQHTQPRASQKETHTHPIACRSVRVSCHLTFAAARTAISRT
uniref:Uncharacterized protein, isoform A n=1 Tax=Drosophila pseudoobscura pseudoobscura TaxID=46245 RepID=A0A0R3NWN2_DROPS